MTGYTKLFGTIVASTIWREAKETKIVWITMLAMANKNGIVEASVPGLADMARVSVEECKEALACLEGPDEYSRTKEHEGRRIERVDGGWLVLNHAKYRAKMNADERRVYLTGKKREERARKKGSVDFESTNVNNGRDLSTPSTHAEAEAEADCEIARKTPSLEEVIAFGAQIGAKRETCESFLHGNESRPIAPNGNWTFKDGSEIHRWKSALAKFNVTWKGNDAERIARKGEKPKEDHLASRHASL